MKMGNKGSVLYAKSDVFENILRYGRLRNLLLLFEIKHNIRLEHIEDEELSGVLDALYYEVKQ